MLLLNNDKYCTLLLQTETTFLYSFSFGWLIEPFSGISFYATIRTKHDFYKNDEVVLQYGLKQRFFDCPKHLVCKRRFCNRSVLRDRNTQSRPQLSGLSVQNPSTLVGHIIDSMRSGFYWAKDKQVLKWKLVIKYLKFWAVSVSNISAYSRL